ncbi:MAG: 16S rRNA (cytosine(967)-C(5))-methyltransferase RsmB [Vicinamibacterales bacterium]
MIAPARLAAYDVLRAVNGGRADLPAALAQARSSLADERDRSLASEIAIGTLRWQGAFDHVIASYARRPIQRLDFEILQILRLTIFQLLHLDRVPASAAVNDAVDLARKAGKRSAAPLVNAVLRRTSRERGHLPLPPRASAGPDAPLDYLAITLSHPRWLAARWFDRYGFAAAEAWCQFDNQAGPLTLRANRLRNTREELAAALAAVGVVTEDARFAPDALLVTHGNPLLTPLASAGLFVVQDEASQLVAIAVSAVAGERVLDACAAPGGKTTAMAAGMGDRGLIVAADVRPKRVRLLRDAVRAAGARSVRVIRANAAQPLPFGDVFDAVLIDAPCSGLGTLRRDPDIKWRRTEDELATMADLQVRILSSAAAVARPGGRVIYSTCSSEPEENDHVIKTFLSSTAGFADVPLQLPCAPELIDDEGRLRTLPFRDGLEAFFAAQLVKAPILG